MAAAATAKLFELQPVWRALFVFRRYVITLFALGALQNNIVSRHSTSIAHNSFPLKLPFLAFVGEMV
jgi:hypothetical protein